MTEAYRRGFLTKCAERGIGPVKGAMLLKLADLELQDSIDWNKLANPPPPDPNKVYPSDISTAAGVANAAGNWSNSHFAPYNPNSVLQPGMDQAVKDNESAPLGYNPIPHSALRDPNFNGDKPFSPQQDFDSLSPAAKERFDKIRTLRPDHTIAFPSHDDPDRPWTYVSPDGKVSGTYPSAGKVHRMRMPSRPKAFGEQMDDQATRQEDRFYTGVANRSDPRMMQMAGLNTNMPSWQAF